MHEINPFDFFFGPRRDEDQSIQPNQRQQGLGSGFIVDLKNGYVISNNHVVEQANEIALKLANGRVYDGRIVGRDPATDIAVIQIKDKAFERKGLTELKLATSDKGQAGEFVLALGAPFGLEASVSFGVISASRRGNLDIIEFGNFMQTDAAINPGNSGGPLVDMNGDVIGMNTAIFSRSGTSAGIGFAIPAPLVRTVATELINNGKVARGYLGIRLDQDLTEDIAVGLGLPPDAKGALVSEIHAGSPAEKAKLTSGDVITAVNGKKVTNRAELLYQVRLMKPPEKVVLEYLRAAKTFTTSLVLAPFPEQKIASGGSGAPNAPGGLKLEVLSSNARIKALRTQFGFVSKKGLLVTAVAPASEAEINGIRPGDVLLQLNHRPLGTVNDFAAAYQKNKRILIQLERSGRTLFATVRR